MAIDYSKFRPTLDHVLIRRKKAETKTKSGLIHIPDNAQEKPAEGEVIKVGPGWVYDNGRRQEPVVKIGDHVLFGKYSGSQMAGLDALDVEYMIIREGDILAVVED
jgi:chaperonin GroES